MSDQAGGFADLMRIARARAAIPSALFDEDVVTLEAKEPTVLVLIGDMHLGAPGLDHDRLEQDVQHLSYAKKFLRDKLHIIGNGDFIDGYLPSGTPLNPYQVLSPAEQRRAATEMLDLLQPSWVIEGDHDMWHSKAPVEHSWLFEYAQRKGIPYAQWGGTLKIETKAGTLTGLVRHRYSGSTNGLDHLAPHRRLHSALGPADFTALNHFHSFAGAFKVYPKRRGEKQFWALQGGTYKLKDEHGKKLGLGPAEYGVPALLVHPDGHLQGFDRYEDALNAVT